ncbi:MAG: hypothetical protein J6D26_00635 [Clostridia bacterium]|nr:hypothetical protein [Clostridia bacterium]
MLKLSVGYQYSEKFSFSEIVSNYSNSIEEVYFPWIDSASGRSIIGGYDGYFDYGLQNILIDELKKIKKMGIKLDLLFNANCYGEDSMSEVLCGKICSVIDFLAVNDVAPDIITTTSPAIAFMVKEHYNNIELKASVNMKISTVKGMQYVSHLFDSFCVAKECNRNIEQLKVLKAWAVENNKKITILANSGCMRDCSGQIFHDNMVAHEAEISNRKNIKFLPYMCWNYLKNPENYVSVLQNTWIRPEDIHNYDGLVDTVKLATRSHQLPGMVIGAYARRRYFGNLLDLFEPGYGAAFAPYVVDSSKIPDDFWPETTKCKKDCSNCDYCNKVLKNALVIA